MVQEATMSIDDLTDVIAEQLDTHVDHIPTYTNLTDLQMDEIDVVEICTTLQTEHDVPLAEHFFDHMKNTNACTITNLFEAVHHIQRNSLEKNRKEQLSSSPV